MQVLSNPGNRKRALFILAVCAALAAASAIVGISDNPPGIVLAFLSAGAFIVAFVHPWRTPRPFLLLLLAAAIGFVVLAAGHNFFEVVGDRIAGPPLLKGLLQGVGVIAFLLAILVAPAAFVVGAVGAAMMAVRAHGRPRPTSGNEN